MNKYYVYAHKKKGTDEIFYIGKGSGRRLVDNRKRSNWWLSTVAKYGFDAIILEDNLSEAEAFKMEIKLIAKYGRRDQGKGILVNLTDGGGGCCSLDVQKSRSIKISKAHKGKEISKETRNKISKTLKEYFKTNDNYFKGQKHSIETKNKISKAAKGIVSPLKGTKKSKKKIAKHYKVVLDFATGIYYESAQEAAELNNINYSTLCYYLRGKIKNKTTLKYV